MSSLLAITILVTLGLTSAYLIDIEGGSFTTVKYGNYWKCIQAMRAQKDNSLTVMDLCVYDHLEFVCPQDKLSCIVSIESESSSTIGVFDQEKFDFYVQKNPESIHSFPGEPTMFVPPAHLTNDSAPRYRGACCFCKHCCNCKTDACCVWWDCPGGPCPWCCK